MDVRLVTRPSVKTVCLKVSQGLKVFVEKETAVLIITILCRSVD